MQENISQIERQKRFVIRFLYWGIMIGTLLFLGKYLIPVLFPFMIAFIVAGMLNKPIHYISKKLKIKRRTASRFHGVLFIL